MTTSNEMTVREAVGVFFDAEHLKDAVRDLLASGFENEELGLLASEHTVKEALGDFYTRVNEDQDSKQAPAIAFVGKESVGEAAESMGGSLFFVGASGAMGAVVAVGLVGLLVSAVIHQSDADHLQEQVDKGHILLFVRTATAAMEQQALDILSRHCAVEVKIHEARVKPGEGAKAG